LPVPDGTGSNLWDSAVVDGRNDWSASYVDRATNLFEDAVRTNAQLARQWRDRSLGDDEWTVDTITADAIEAWEHLTPLAERGLELWLELVQRAMRPGASS
jgi:hypothetical protein